MKLVNNKKGITIIELLVAMTIFIVAITIAIGSFVSITRLNSQANIMSNVQQNARILGEQLTRLSRTAIEVSTVDNGDMDQITIKDVSGTYMCFKPEGTPKQLKKYNKKCSEVLGSDIGLTLTSNQSNITKLNFQKVAGVPASLNIVLEMQSVQPIFALDNDRIKIDTSVVMEGLR